MVPAERQNSLSSSISAEKQITCLGSVLSGGKAKILIKLTVMINMLAQNLNHFSIHLQS